MFLPVCAEQQTACLELLKKFVQIRSSLLDRNLVCTRNLLRDNAGLQLLLETLPDEGAHLVQWKAHSAMDIEQHHSVGCISGFDRRRYLQVSLYRRAGHKSLLNAVRGRAQVCGSILGQEPMLGQFVCRLCITGYDFSTIVRARGS
jgi:hypothetical protein